MTCRLTCSRSFGLVVSALALAACTLPSLAQESTSRRVRNACASDAHRLCPREKPNSPEMNYCMEAKGRQLSRNCIRALEDEGTVPRGYFGKS